MVDKKAQGKRNKRKGSEFELAVRKDLESKGWIVSKWQNNVEFTTDLKEVLELLHFGGEVPAGKLIPAKHKFNPFRRAMSMGTGFPDFIAFQAAGTFKFNSDEPGYIVIGVEAKTNGYLDKEEKAKCDWLLAKKIFSRILIAKKKDKEIEYIEWK